MLPYSHLPEFDQLEWDQYVGARGAAEQAARTSVAEVLPYSQLAEFDQLEWDQYIGTMRAA